jgi:hypothetical protein
MPELREIVSREERISHDSIFDARGSRFCGVAACHRGGTEKKMILLQEHGGTLVREAAKRVGARLNAGARAHCLSSSRLRVGEALGMEIDKHTLRNGLWSAVSSARRAR